MTELIFVVMFIHAFLEWLMMGGADPYPYDPKHGKETIYSMTGNPL